MNPVLKASSISVSFGGVRAVVDVDLEVGEGQLVGLIGPNGAGKTTFIDAITGFTPFKGNVELDGRDISRLQPHRRSRLGLARTWQSIELFDDLSIVENLTVASDRPTALGTLKQLLGARPGDTSAIFKVLRQLGLEDRALDMPDDLSQGQRKLVGVARALVADPRLVCLDEPAAGLDTHESYELGRRLRELADAGQSMLLVDHDMGLVLGISDYVYVLEFGRLIANGPPEVVRKDSKVIEAYLGSAAAALRAEVEEVAQAVEGS